MELVVFSLPHYLCLSHNLFNSAATRSSADVFFRSSGQRPADGVWETPGHNTQHFPISVAVTMTVIQRNQQMVVIPSHDLQEKYPNETRDHQNTEQQMP